MHLEMEFPFISMKLLNEENPGDEMARLAKACNEWGCFQLIDHGIPEETIDAIAKSFKDFFNLPQKVKEKKTDEITDPEKPVYDKKGLPFLLNLETHYKKNGVPVFRVENEYDEPPPDNKPEAWVEHLILPCRPLTEHMKSSWPEKPLGLPENINNYATEMQRVGEKLLKCLAVNMGLNPNSFLDVYGGKDSATVIVIVNCISPVPDGAAALTAPRHRDNGGLTLLLSVDGKPGLQVVKDGEWHSVPWRDSYSLVVSCGDLMEVISNGRYKSLVHRGANLGKGTRFSVATGFNPNPFVKMGPVAGLIDEDHPRLYGEGRHVDFLEAAKVEPVTCFEYFSSLKG